MAPAGYGSRVEGIHSVGAAVAAGRVLQLHIEAGRSSRSDVAALITEVGHDHVTFHEDLRAIASTEAPQGVVAECRPILPVTLENLAEASEGTPAVLVLDHVEDPQNLGAIARSAQAAGLTGMVVSARRAAPLSAAAFKAAAGALETVPLAIVGSIPEALSRLRDLGLWIVGLDAGAEQGIFGLDLLTEPVAVVVGAEGGGLARLSRQRCDLLVSIPMVDDVESLNASVSGALAAFEIMRVRRASSQ